LGDLSQRAYYTAQRAYLLCPLGIFTIYFAPWAYLLLLMLLKNSLGAQRLILLFCPEGILLFCPEGILILPRGHTTILPRGHITILPRGHMYLFHMFSFLKSNVDSNLACAPEQKQCVPWAIIFTYPS
jgi:hypothetical protein